MVKASVIIPTINRGEVLCSTIEMALAQNYSDYEILVIDQTLSHSPSVQSFLDSVKSKIRYFHSERPNLPAARNLGIRAATGEIVVFVDDDVVFSEDYVLRHVNNYHDPKVGGVNGLTLPNGNADIQQILLKLTKRHEVSISSLDGTMTMSWMNGCNTSFRREALLEAGLFDEYYAGSGWCEDADMSVRVLARGHKLILDPELRLVHLALPSGGSENRSRADKESRMLQHLQYYEYYALKNRRFFGLKRSIQMLATAYKGLGLTRLTITNSPWRIVNQNLRFLEITRRALLDSIKNTHLGAGQIV